MSVPPKLLKRARLSTKSTSPLRACVFTYTLSWNVLAVLICALIWNVLVHTPDKSELEALPCSTYCCPKVHAWHSLAVISLPTSRLRLVKPSK